MRSATKKIALCGVLASLSLICLIAGGFLPFATYVLPCFAGVLLIPVAAEYGTAAELEAFAAVGLLGLFLVPDKEEALSFVFFLGYYPAVKPILDKIRSSPLRWVCKYALFNGAFLCMYLLLLFVFPLADLSAEFAGYTKTFLVILILLANVTFAVYDLALNKAFLFYTHRLRPRIFGRSGRNGQH